MYFVRNRYANWMRHHAAANWVQAQPAAVSCRRGRRCAVPCGGRRGASLFPGRTAEKALRCFPLTGLYGSTAEKPPTGRFFWIVRIGSLLGGFSLTKAPSFAIRNLDCKIHPQRCLNDKGVSSSAELDQRRRLWKLPPFEKGGRKLYFIETRSREVKSWATHSTDT